VEAGLRTGNLQSPWPEEANRVLTSRITSLHFCPTETAKQNLLREGVDPAAVFVTGNTVIDALLWTRKQLERPSDAFEKAFLQDSGVSAAFARRFLLNGAGTASCSGPPRAADGEHPPDDAGPTKMILVTGHRRESFGRGFENICTAIRTLADQHSNVGIVYPVHLNPHVQEPVKRLLGNHPRIELIPPVGYKTFVWLMSRSHFILSDSGGVQEEAPSLGKPVLVMRDTTERPEGIAAGTCRLVGTDPEKILSEGSLLLTDQREYGRRSTLKNPYGDGMATHRILEACQQFLFGLHGKTSERLEAQSS
jgi:UDP-N-acetylglucosamine 2-epimerase (non-hydrolysing)